MKKITALLILLLLLVSVTYASTTLTFSGDCTVVGANGRTIRKSDVEIDEKGIVVVAENEKITAAGDGIRVIIGKGTIATLLDDGSVFTLYVVTGEGAVVTTSPRSIRIYTPTTLTEAENEGDYYVRSTEDEEYFFNHSSSEVKTYDAIRGTYTQVAPGSGYDIITKSTLSSEKEEEEKEDEIIEIKTEEPSPEVASLPRVPAAPVFAGVERTVTLIDEPVITEAEREAETAAESVSEGEKTAAEEEKKKTASSPSIRITQTLVDIDDENDN